MITFLIKIYKFFISGSFFLSKDLKSQKDFLHKLLEPVDDRERSYNQYRCQMFLWNKTNRFFFTFGAFLILPFVVLKGILSPKIKKVNDIDGKAIFLAGFKGIRGRKRLSLLPDSLMQEYKVEDIIVDNGGYLRGRDIKFIWKLVCKYPFSFLFLYKCIYKITLYRGIIDKYKPATLIVFHEYSFPSSLMTQFCQENSVLHINIMHGEKLFTIRDSFFRFHKFYVWDEYYIKLYCDLRAVHNQYIVERPHTLKIHGQQYVDDACLCEYKYYLGEYTESQIQYLSRLITILQAKGKEIKFRPHPEFSDISLLKKYIPEQNIEWSDHVGIEKSITNSSYALATYSTVLYQAYLAGKKVIIDDVFFPKDYDYLKDADYIMMTKPHLLLSQLLS